MREDAGIAIQAPAIETPAVQAPAAVQSPAAVPTAKVDRRRPGRRDQVAPALIGLLRGTAPALDGEWALPLDPARGLLTAAAFGLLGWAGAAWMVTRLLG